MPATTFAQKFKVSWSGSDLHSGIDKYAVFVSVNGGIYKPWKSSTTEVSDTFYGVFNNTYRFYSIATDMAGNLQQGAKDPLASPDAVTILIDETKTFSIRNGLWSDPGTWSTGKVPTALTEVTVKHIVAIDINAECKSLKAEFPAGVHLNTGKTLAIKNQ